MQTPTPLGRQILALWSAPRSRSTAFFRMMLERGDVRAVHEPFSTRAEHGAVDIYDRRATTELEVMDALRELSASGPVFFKDTTDERYPEVLADTSFLGAEVRSTFIIRHPAETIASYYAINPRVRLDQIGVENLHELFTVVRNRTGVTPVVVDSDDLVRAPVRTVKRYCRALDLPYDSKALSWSAADRPEWRATGRWHRDVSQTTGFELRPPLHGVRTADHLHLLEYLNHHLPYYHRLRSFTSR